MKFLTEKNYSLFFDIGIIIKAVITVFELILGFVFYAMSTEAINGVLTFFIGGEANEQPRDWIWSYFIQGFQGLLGPQQSFWAFIFVSHGIVKIAALIGMYYNKLWSYPVAAAIFAGLAIYQIYTYAFIHSVLIVLVTIFDFILIGLILHEWRRRQRLAI